MPYWRLSSFYFFYFASLGALIPYWSLYLEFLHFNASQMGMLMAVMMGTKIVAPVLWGMIADRTGRGMPLIHLASLCGALSFFSVLFLDGFWPLAMTLAVFSFFWNASLPQFEAVTLNHLGDHHHRYTQIRVWGSVGFIMTVVLLGALLEFYDARVVPVSVLFCMVGIWLCALAVPPARAFNDRGPAALWPVLRRPEVIALFLVCLLIQAGHGPYYALYSKYMVLHGYSKLVIGVLWALGVLTEVVVFVFLHRLTARWGMRRFFLGSLVLAALRWLLIAYAAASPWVQVWAQMLHAASFGVYHAVAIQMIHRFFKGRLQGRGQALYSAVSFGAGGAIGSFYSGLIWDHVSPSMMYVISALLSLVAFLIAWRFIHQN